MSEKRLTPEEARDWLKIAEDDLDRCLMEQAELYECVATEYETTVGERDAAKLALEEGQADTEVQLRSDAAKVQVKITDSSVVAQVTSDVRVKSLQREHLRARGAVGKWTPLKKAFEMRANMLEALAYRQSTQMKQLGMEHGGRAARSRAAETAEERQRAERRRERE